MRRKIAVVIGALVLSTINAAAFAPPTYACAEPDPRIGCIGPCARPLQGSPTCPNEDNDGKGGKGNGQRP